MLRIKEGIVVLTEVINYKFSPRERRRLTFYSENKSYWPHMQGLLHATLEKTNKSICYISSSRDDPGLKFKHPNLDTFFIGAGFVRDYFFETLDTDIMIMTMPSLNNFQIKRSRNKVHYVYVQHSLASLHMIYEKCAFNHYDTICAAGPHHVREIKAIEAKYGLPSKNIVKLGYSRLDSLIKKASSYKRNSSGEKYKPKKILIAPSWGEQGIIESGLCKKLVEQLLNLGHEVILRPHFQTIKFSNVMVDEIKIKHKENIRFLFENSTSGQKSLHQSDLMVSDWSGIALEYAFAFNKPVIFCDVPKKINNPYYREIDLVPIEVSIREKIGVIWDGKSPISETLELCNQKTSGNFTHLIDEYCYNKGRSDDVFVEMINKLDM